MPSLRPGATMKPRVERPSRSAALVWSLWSDRSQSSIRVALGEGLIGGASVEAQTTKLAVLGLGTMGRAMASSALRGGVPTVVWDRNLAVARDLVERGAEVAESAVAAVQTVDVVITMVTDGKAVTSIAIDLGMLEALPPGAVWAQTSTIGLEATEAIAEMVEQRRSDVFFLDAPVSGSKVPAEEGKLTIFASGSQTARPKVEPVFAAIGQRTIWLGPVGAGSRMNS